MEIDMPQDMNFLSAEAEEVEARIKFAADNDAEFIFFIQEDTSNLHGIFDKFCFPVRTLKFKKKRHLFTLEGKQHFWMRKCFRFFVD